MKASSGATAAMLKTGEPHAEQKFRCVSPPWSSLVIWNETIPDRLRGRLAGVEMISYTSGPTLGSFEAGAVASLTSVRTSVVSGGVMCVVGTALLVAALPTFWRYDARRAETEAPAREEAVAGAP